MFGKLKDFIFPCDKVIRQLMAEHSISVNNNKAAHEKFMRACSDTVCVNVDFRAKNNDLSKGA